MKAPARGHPRSAPGRLVSVRSPCAVLFLLTLLVPIASTADPAPLPDLWVSELRATAVGGSPFDGTDVRVTIACTRPDLFTTSAGAQLWVNDEPTPRHVVAFDATSLQFTRRLTLQTDDEVRVILDPSDSVEEVNELNNWLVKAIGDVWGSNPCSPYPFSFTIPSPDDPDDPSQDLTLECVRCERSQRTGYFPWAYLILPPYEWDESDPNGTMRTELSSGTFSGSESSNTTGFTAGIAVEASGGIPFVAEVKIGLEIEREWSQEHGLGTETSQSETFWTDTSAGAGPGLGEPAVVVSQTTHEVAEYRVITSGNWYGESFVIATPLREPFRDNPELLQVGHSTYDDIRDPEAVELVEYHWVGSADTYPDSHHGWRHLASVTNPRWHLLAKRSQYNIAGADWDITRRRYSQSTTTVTTRVNAYASGSFLAAGAQASFGTLDGRSHRTWHGTETTYHWTVGPTYGPRFGYRLMGLAENLYFEHDPLGNGKVRQDRVLLLDYYMVERARGWPWSTWESFLEHVLRGENWVINWPEAPTHGFPDALAAVLVQPAAGTPSLYYDHLRTLTGALDDWAQEFPADRVDEMRERIADLDHDVQTVQLYDPNNSAYYDLFALQLAEIMAEGDRVLLTHGASVPGPTTRTGEIARFGYDPLVGTLPDDAAPVLLRWTEDEGSTWFDIPMDPLGPVWFVEVPVPSHTMEVAFTDGVSLDNRGGSWWPVPTVDTWRTHDNGTLALCVTDHGTLGYLDDSQTSGEGLRIPSGGPNCLRIGGLWVGNDLTVANRDYAADPAPDWVSVSDGGGVGLRAGSGVQSSHAVFTDGAAPLPWGLRVERGVLSRTMTAPGDDEVVFLSYLVRNVSDQPLLGVRVGQLADFDLDGGQPDLDYVDVDPPHALAWMTQPGHPAVGVALLDAPETPEPAVITGIDKAALMDPLGYFEDSMKLELLRGHAPPPPPAVPGDWAVLAAAGPYDLEPGESVAVTFALVTGMDLPQILSNTDRAREWIRPQPTEPVLNITSVAPSALPRGDVRVEGSEPNPFNPSTTIRFLCGGQGAVRVAVYDLRGRLVRELLRAVVEAGPHEVRWDGRDHAGRGVASGVYVVRVAGPNASDARKIALLR